MSNLKAGAAAVETGALSGRVAKDVYLTGRGWRRSMVTRAWRHSQVMTIKPRTLVSNWRGAGLRSMDGFWMRRFFSRSAGSPMALLMRRYRAGRQLRWHTAVSMRSTPREPRRRSIGRN